MWTSILGGTVVVTLSTIIWLLWPIIIANAMIGNQIEETYFDPHENRSKKFPTIYDPPSVYLSVIVPAYNEEARISYMLDECIRYLLRRSSMDSSGSFTWEIVVVDDGSSDKTIVVVRDYVKRYGSERVRLLRLIRNRGKGGAVRQGMMVARGQRLLMADADGATRFGDVELLESSLNRSCRQNKERFGIAVGSRVQLGDEAKAERSCFRWILQQGFHLLVSVLCVSGVRDTQCGFKLFTRSSAARLFPTQRITRWAFDVELLFLAQKIFFMPIEEIPVNWTEIAGSKVDILGASFSMLRDMLIIRICYGCKIWQVGKVAFGKAE